jgi:transcriptional regulator with XRE-family HTH domain
MMPNHAPALSPKQIRAGRALLAWSQQELAKNAGVAASTVADFERGQRTPVPNNAEAMRTALEKAGIIFPPGGAVVGPPLPALAAVIKSGAPIRWVNATDISQWAERRDGQGSLPTLLGKLARATGPTSPHFPSDEGVQFAGWDGTTHGQASSEYVPAGSTGWEIGTQRDDIAGKANSDYDKRTENPGELNPAESTFVFVTPRHWPNKGEWAREKLAQNIWRDVRAYDGTDLVHWIEMYPAVGQWLATYLGKRPAGAHQLEEVWLEWSLATQWQLTPDLILSDRDKDAVAVLRWLRSNPTAFALQGETADEVASFVYAAITQLPEVAAGHYLARCLVAATSDIARALANSITPLIIVLLDPEPGLAQTIAQKGHHVLLAYGSSPSLRGDVQKLERPSRDGIEAALREARLPDDKAMRLARESSRSLAILRRLIPAQPGRLPAWAQNAPPRALVAALLAGAWDERSHADKMILARLADMSYDAFVAGISPFTSHFDSPLRKVGSAWKVASPQDAWFLLAPYLSPSDIERFDEVIVEVLGAADPRYNMDPEQRWYAPIKGIKPDYSEFLRHGLGEILIMLALFGDRAHTVPDANRRADCVVHRLLHEAAGERWWSLSRDFQLLAEAAPGTFLDAVERSLDQNDPPITALFGNDDNPLFGAEHLFDLLWALESLAWAPEYVGRVSGILASLDAIDPGGRYSNRPSNSLRQIFILWLPQTNANLDQRLRVLDRLRKSHPNQAWKLMLGILPSGYDSLSPASTTRWRDLTTDNTEVVTYPLAERGAKAVAERLLADAGADVNRWITLLDRWANLPNRAAAFQKLSNTLQNIRDDKDRTALWSRLRRLLHHHREFPDANWVLPESELTELEGIYNALAPADPIARVSWLFEEAVSLPNPSDGWEAHAGQVRAERRRTAMALVEDQGIDAVLAVANSVEDAGYLGASLVEGGISRKTRDLILDRALKSENVSDHYLAHGVIVATLQTEKERWAEKLLTRALRRNWGDKSALTILRAIPSNQWSWALAHEAGPDIELAYWQQAPIHLVQTGRDSIGYVVDKFIEADRGRDAVHLVGQLMLNEVVPSQLLVKILLETARQPWEKDGDGNRPVMFQHYVAEILKQLDEAEDVPTDTMLNLEWAYLSLLEYSRRPPKVILGALAEKPELFVQIICAVFKPSADSGFVEDPPKDTERAKNIATQAYNLLRLWNVVPGTTPDGKIDGAALETWVKEVRKLAKAAGRDVIADQKIGEVLSAAPIGEDGIWPALPVRELIETVRSGDIEKGVVLGCRNRRGVTTRRPRDGGAQEHDLVKRYSEYSKATALEWFRTSAVLDKIATAYEEDARWHDEDAERLDW